MTQEVYIYRKPGKYGVENERFLQENIIEKVLVKKRVEPLKVELKTFLEATKSGELVVTPEQALKNLMICEEIKKGLETESVNQDPVGNESSMKERP